MDFLLDVNASGAIARWLIDHGHNVSEVGQIDPRMSDDEILNWAVGERRIILTTDRDFEEMVWRQRKYHCGILRLQNLPRYERIILLNYECKMKFIGRTEILESNMLEWKIEKENTNNIKL